MNSSPLLEVLLQRLEASLSISQLSDWLGTAFVNVSLAAGVFALFYVAWRVINRLLASRLRTRIDRTTAAMLETALKTTMLSIGALVALNTAGVQTAAVLTSLGV